MLIGGTTGRRDGKTEERRLEPSGPTQAPASPSHGPAVPSSVAPAPDEFSDFLSEIHATVAQQVDAWRSQIGAAVMRWEGEGYRTGRLQKLLEHDAVPDVVRELDDFERDVQRLRDMETQTAELAADLVGSPAFRDPGDLAAAESLLARARRGRFLPPRRHRSGVWRTGSRDRRPR